MLNSPVYAADKTGSQANIQVEFVPEPVNEDFIKPQIIDRGQINPDQPVSSEAPDYANSINEIHDYVYKHLHDIFASLHIERDDEGREKIILSVVTDVSPSHKDAILALAKNPELVVFRVVDFTEQQLAQKQREIELARDSLIKEGIKIHHTGINVFINRVEIGIEPYNKESITKIHKILGSEMIEVVQGHEIIPLTDGAEPAPALENATERNIAQDSIAFEAVAETEKSGFFQRLASFFKSIFNWLFK